MCSMSTRVCGFAMIVTYFLYCFVSPLYGAGKSTRHSPSTYSLFLRKTSKKASHYFFHLQGHLDQSRSYHTILALNPYSANPQTRKPANPQTRKPANPQTRKPANPQTRKPANPQTRKPANPQTRKPANPQTRKPANPQTRTRRKLANMWFGYTYFVLMRLRYE